MYVEQTAQAFSDIWVGKSSFVIAGFDRKLPDLANEPFHAHDFIEKM